MIVESTELLGINSIVVGLGCNNPNTIIANIGISLPIVAALWIWPLALLPSKFKPVTVIAAHALIKIEYFLSTWNKFRNCVANIVAAAAILAG